MTSLHDLTILLAAGVIAVSLFKRLGLGSVLGYLAAGIVVGPFGLRFIADVHSVMQASELGIVLLLFLIGLELEPSRLWVMRRHVFRMGGAQVGLSTAAFSLCGQLVGLPLATAITVGFALSLSSTAFVMQILTERRDNLHVYGRSAFGILLFQDLAVIPFLAFLPLLSGNASVAVNFAMLQNIGLVFGAFILVGLVGTFLVRPMFHFIASSKNHEIFTAAALLIVIGTALFMQAVGLSMSLGAFLAGVLLANSEYRHEIQANIEPFEGLLLGLFFMSVGMSANISILIDRPLALIGVTLGILVVKAAVLALTSRVAKQNTESILRLALALPQGGEFAFVLLSVAISQQLMEKELADFLIMAVTLSMVLTPFGFYLADRLAERLAGPHSVLNFDTMDGERHPVIIAGFGRFGQIVARMLRMRHITFTALDINQEQVGFVRKFGNKIYYGDASRLDLLRAAAAEHAKVFVIAIDDVEASVRIAELVKKHFPHLQIIARARNRQHVYRLMKLSIKTIFRETFASSVECGEAVLRALNDPAERASLSSLHFRAHDEKVLEAGFAVHHDEKQLIETTKHYAKELESIFEGDQSIERISTAPAKIT